MKLTKNTRRLSRSTVFSALLLGAALGIVPAEAAPTAFAPSRPTSSGTVPVATPRPLVVTPEPTYTLAAGDVVSVNVINFPNLTVPQTTVAPDGKISLPLLGLVTVAGQTIDGTAALLAHKWDHYVISPSVTVSLVQKHIQNVVFNGSVNRAGPIDYRPGMRLLGALAEVGGPTATGADLTDAVVTHADGSEQTLDLSHPETKTDTEVNLVLQPGDVVYIPEELGKVSVVGEVKEPGSYIYREGLTVLDVVNASGGYNPDTADLWDAKLTHDGKDRPIDLNALLKQGVMSANANVYPGDRLVIPELHNRTYVYGAVLHPGFYYYKPGDTIQDALNNAEVTPEADLDKINVIHVNQAKTAANLVRVDFGDYLKNGNIKGNPAVAPGDSLYLPTKHHTPTFSDVLGPLASVGSIAYSAHVVGL